MLPWILTAGLLSAIAAEPDDAAALLSRYPAGQVPSSAPVMDAILSLQRNGTADHLGVLQSMRSYEGSPVREAATGAIAIVTLRARLLQREHYEAPDRGAVRAWLSAHPTLTRRDGTVLGPRESEVVAYTVLVFGEPQQVWAQMPSVLVNEGEKREDQSNLGGALVRFAFAAAHGDHEARTLLETFGLDEEKLLLGLTADTELTNTPPAEASDALVQLSGAQTVSVLIERSRSSSEIPQVQALDALAEMIRRGQLPAASRRAARQRLEDATQDVREPMRVFAQAVLQDLEP